MLKPGTSGRGCIAGEAGEIEVLVETPRKGDVQGIAVIAHPHPLHGGTMDNKVVYMLSRAAHDAGLVSLRFNFRGVGKSTGPHAEGLGEGRDLLRVVEFARVGWPDMPLALAGFSFGSFIALANTQAAGACAVLTVAPPLFYAADTALPDPGVPWWVIHGDADEVVDYDDTMTRARAASHPPERIQTAPGVGHFFHGELPQLRTFAREFFETARR